jgi:hypothetical protein
MRIKLTWADGRSEEIDFAPTQGREQRQALIRVAQGIEDAQYGFGEIANTLPRLEIQEPLK